MFYFRADTTFVEPGIVGNSHSPCPRTPRKSSLTYSVVLWERLPIQGPAISSLMAKDGYPVGGAFVPIVIGC